MWTPPPSLPLETWVREEEAPADPRPPRSHKAGLFCISSSLPALAEERRKSGIRYPFRTPPCNSLSLPGKCGEPPTNNAPGAGGGGEASQANNQYQHGDYGKEGERREREGDGMRPRAPVGRLPCKSKTAEVRRTEARTDGRPEKMRTEGGERARREGTCRPTRRQTRTSARPL